MSFLGKVSATRLQLEKHMFKTFMQTKIMKIANVNISTSAMKKGLVHLRTASCTLFEGFLIDGPAFEIGFVSGCAW